MLGRIFLAFLLLSSLIYAQQIIKIGVLAKRSHDITLAKWSATADYLTQQIEGFSFEIVPLSFEALSKSVKNKEIDFVLTNTMYYVELEHSYGISRIATLKNRSRSGKTVTNFGGVIFTQKSSKIKTVDDLKGKRFGAVNINSFGGWVMAQKELHDHGITADDFAQLRFFGSHDAVVLAVRNGEIDAGTVRTDTIERMGNEGLIDPSLCRTLSAKQYPDFPFRVSTALYPEWPFAKLPSTSQQLSDKVLIALLQITPYSQAAQNAQIEGWTIPLDYSKVHHILEALHIGPYAELSKLTLTRIYERYKVWFYAVSALFLVIVTVLLYISRLNSKLRDKTQEIEALNSGLEDKVQERTQALEAQYIHEKYLKNLLKTIADVNELLMSSFSIQTIVKNSMERLIRQKHYRFVWIGLIEENLLEVVSQSSEDQTLFSQRRYDLKNDETNIAFQSAYSAIDQNKTVINILPESFQITLGNDTYDYSAYWMLSMPLRSGHEEAPLGMISVFSNNEEGFESEEIKMLENLATDIGMALHSIRQHTVLELMELQKISNYEETILAFVHIIELRDSYTAGHTIRVATYCRIIAEAMQIEEDQIVLLEKAAILHDIGKVVTPDAILLKPGNLSPLEFELIKQHADAGYRMLSKIEMYKDLAEIIRYHHTRYDGTGYPATPKDAPETVPLLSYIMTVADAFDAMTSNRIYKSRKSIEEALKELLTFSGSQFHPEVAVVAHKALENVTVPNTSQLPDSELEQRRFAYFFLDSLTDMYNENYLKMILIQHESEERCMHLISLGEFAQYNQDHGWEAGNALLKAFAQSLIERYPDAVFFRYHGYNFILLFASHHHIDVNDIKTMPSLQNSGIEIHMQHYDLEKGIPTL